MQKGKIELTQKDAENTPAGGVVVGKREGQTMIYDDASLGGYFVGKLHKDGGIQMINKSTGQPLEVQGSEVIITAPAVNDPTKHNFNGQIMTNREILSKINSDGGGVSFADGGDIPAKIHTTDKEYEYGGKMVHDTDIAHSLGMNSTLKKGKQHFSFKNKTYDVDGIYNAIKKGKISYKTKEVEPFAMKYPIYDQNYAENHKIDFRKPNGIMVKLENGEEVLIDGNHRMNNALLKGRKTMKTYYIDDPKQIAKFTKNNKFELGGENVLSNKQKQEIIDSQNKFFKSNDIYKLSSDSFYVLRKDNNVNPPKYKKYTSFEDFYSDIKTREINSIERENAKKTFEYLEENGAELQNKSIYGSRYYFYKGNNIRVSNHWQTSEIKCSETGLNKYRDLPSFYSDKKDGWKKMIDEIENFVKGETFELGGENNNFQNLVEEKFADGYGKVKYFELNSSGGKWSYVNNPNVTRSQRDKMPVYTVDLSNDERNKANEIKKNYEIKQPKEISILQFAQKFANDNNGEIYHKSKSGSVYVRVKDKDIRISDHYILDRDSMNPKSRYNLEIIQRYFNEKTPSNLDYWTDEFKEGGHLSKGKSLKQIAEIHNVSLAHINDELAKGLEVEKEHFADFKERTRVAKDHLVENPNYYSILEKAGLAKGGDFDSKPFLDYYFEEIEDFLKDQNDIRLEDDFTFRYKGESFIIQPLIMADKDSDEKIKTANFVVLDSENDVLGEIYFDVNNKKKFSAYSDFFDWENVKFYAGGETDSEDDEKENLVKDAKSGNTPARDLNNYNDVLDLDADGAVGGDNGLAFADGGELNSKIKNADLSELLDMVESGKYADGGGIELPKVAYVKVVNAGSSLSNIIDNKYNSYIEFAESVKYAYNQIGRTVRSYVSLQAYDNNDNVLVGVATSISNQKNTVKNYNPLTGNYKNLEKSLANSKPISFTKYDWQNWLLSKGISNIQTSQNTSSNQSKYPEYYEFTAITVPSFTNGKIYKIVNPKDINDLDNFIDNFGTKGGYGYKNKDYFEPSTKEAFEAQQSGALTISNSNSQTSQNTSSNQSKYPEYYEYVGAKNSSFTIGKIYKAVNPQNINTMGNFIDDFGIENGWSRKNDQYFKPSTKEAFEAQQSGVLTTSKPFDLSETKVWIGDDPKLSEEIQKVAFELGWQWSTGLNMIKNTEDFALLFNKNKTIQILSHKISFNENIKREITPQDILLAKKAVITTSNNDNNNNNNPKPLLTNLSLTKIWIGNNPEMSEKVQKRAFELGWMWSSRDGIPQHTYQDSLYFFPDKSISVGDAGRNMFEAGKFREIFADDLFLSVNTQIPTSNQVVPKTTVTTTEKIKDLKKAVNVLESIASEASKKYNTKNYEEALELLKETKEEYSLALSFTPESSFMYERIELLKKINEVQREITNISELKNGGAFYVLSKVIERLEKGENWKESGKGEIMTNEVSQQEIEDVIYTEKFKNWFGNWEQALVTKEYDYVSKALTEKGMPCVMYHGAKRIKYSYRQVSNGVVYLAENRSYAEWFSENESPYQKQGDYLTQCFVNLKNPIDLTVFKADEVDLRDIIQYIDAVYPLAKIYDVLPPNTAMAIMNNQLIGRKFRAWYIIRQFPELNKHIRDNTTYDGFIYYENNPSDLVINQVTGEMEENITKATAVFNSNQVKLVDAILFDSSLDDWRFEQGGKVNQ